MVRAMLVVAMGVGVALSAQNHALADSAVMGPHLNEDARSHGGQLADLELEASLDARAGLKPSMGRQLTEKLTLWSNELGTHVNLLTLDLVDLNFDIRQRHAAVRVGALAESIGLRVDGDIKVRKNVARVQSSLALGLRGRTYEIDLPAFEVTTQDVGGERSVELRLPIIEGRF